MLFRWKISTAYIYLLALIIGSLAYSAEMMSTHFATFCDMNVCSGGLSRRAYRNQLRAMILSATHFCESDQKADVQVYYYDKPWTRFPPYGIRMLLALLFVHRRRRPDPDTGEITAEQQEKLNIYQTVPQSFEQTARHANSRPHCYYWGGLHAF